MQRTKNNQNNFSKEEQSWKTTQPCIKTSQNYKIKTVLKWHKEGHINLQNRKQNPDIESYIYAQLHFVKGTTVIQSERTIISSNGAGKIAFSVGKNMSLDSSLNTYTINNLKWKTYRRRHSKKKYS